MKNDGMTSNQAIENLLDRNLPSFTLAEVQQIAIKHYGLKGEFTALVSERDQSFRVQCANNEQFIFKISNSSDDYGTIDFQTQALLHIEKQNSSLPVPRIIKSNSGDSCTVVEGERSNKHVVRLLSYLPGVLIDDAPESNTKSMRKNVGSTIATLDIALRGFFHPHAQYEHPWDTMKFMNYRPHTQHITNKKAQQQIEFIFDYVNDHLMPSLTGLRHQVVHQDVHGGNALLDPKNLDTLSGIIDFGDMLYAPLIMELVVASDMFLRSDDPVAEISDLIAGYDAVIELEELEIDLLYDLILVRISLLITICAWRAAMRPDEAPYVENMHEYYQALDELSTMGRENVTSRFREACRFPAYSPAIGSRQDINLQTEETLRNKRRHYLGEKIWHFYKQPLHFERAKGPWLYGVDGKRYLDLYNNVPQVGHCNPHVTRAISRQAKTLNTSTRYLYQIILDYSERLTNLLPEHLQACIFFNSGSEANDIALQMARLISGHQGAIVVEDAYHGITETIMNLSPEGKLDIADYVATLRAPCSYRGVHADKDNSAELYAADADAAIKKLRDNGSNTACFMIDTALCSSGVLDVPEGYFNLVGEKVRSAGGLIIADEVQSGFGRLGQMWGHQARGLKADIVTMGKPIGNGHPLGALVTSKAILDRFIEETGLFSTFGGNPVSCAAGMAVLDVIEDENLIDNANSTGDYLRQQLQQLAKSQPLIGDVRGQGMLAAVEFVKDRVSKEPATAETEILLELMREQGILIGSSGPNDNCLKLRPSLVFQPRHVDRFIAALDNCLSQL